MTKRFVSFLALLWVAGIGIQSLIRPTPAHAQQRVQLTNPETGERVVRTYPEGADVLFPITPDPSTGWPHQKAAVINPQDTAQVIVEFKRRSVVRQRAQLRKQGVPSKTLGGRLQAHRAELEGLLDRFRRDLREIARGEGDGSASQKAAPMGQETRITREYTEVFSGTAVTTRQWAAEQIQALSYVEAVHPDREVEAVVGDARKVVDAEALQAAQGATGEGVEIGIIDTGIDYTHPALGGGFGPDNKVVGGYDFVNEDDDPIDNNGHGTHVAGIAAADGDSITGVAPGAKLRAYKVLNSNGRGSSSDIIAGIEQAVKDGVDIINMSLGGAGTPSDPNSQATDNASRAGVLPVVAAGNSGPDYQTVGAPGAARRALTVGASNDSDQIAEFSSRGPTDGAFTVKPDVVAPGVDIRSTLPNGDYGELSGTSMASPVTAGVAALLLDLHPGWGPTFTKGALMKTGVDIGEDLWTRGHGRVDADDAAEAEVVATPGILSFGLVDNGQDTWTHTDTLKFRNRGDAPRTYQLSTGPNPASGIRVDLSASSVTVAGGDSALVPVTAVVNNDVAPFPEGRPPAYTGRVVATADQDTMEVPYGLVKAPSVTLSFGDHIGAAVVFVHRTESMSFKAQYTLAPNEIDILLPKVDKYDFVVWLKSFRHPANMYLVGEDISASETPTLTLGPRQAKHTVTTRFKDEKGRSVPNPLPTRSFMIKKKTGAGIFAVHSAHGQGISNTRFSTISDEYTFKGMLLSHQYENGRLKDYRFPYQFSGISEDKSFTNDPGALRKTTYRLDDDVVRRAFFSNLTHAHFFDHPVEGPVWLSSWRASVTATEPELTTPTVADLYVLPSPTADYKMYPAYRIIDPSSDDIGDRGLYQTASPQIAGPDTTAFYRFLDFSEGVRRSIEELGPIDIGGPPSRWAAEAQPGDRLDAGLGSGWFEGPFKGVWLGDVQYERYEKGRLAEEDILVNSGSVINRGIGERSLSDFGAGDSLVTRFEHPIAGRDGHAELRFAPGTGELRSRFERFQILSSGRVSDTLDNSQVNAIRAAVDSPAAVKSMTAYLRAADSSTWRQIGEPSDGGNLQTEIPSSLATGHYAVRVVAKGKGGGQVEQVADPAFWFGQRREGTPSPPTASTVTNYLDSLFVGWSSPFAADVASYRIYRDTAPLDSATGPSGYEALASVGAQATGYVDTSVQSGQTYHYRITAVDSSGHESGFSGKVNATARTPALTFAGVEEIREYLGNDDGTVQAGEFLFIFPSFVNETDSTLSRKTYARVDSTADRFVHPIWKYGFIEHVRASRELPAGETTPFQGYLQFHVAESTPVGHVLTVPMQIYDKNDRLIGRDTLEMRVEGPDETAPAIGESSVDIRPGYAPPGEPMTISVYVREASRQIEVEATIKRRSDGQRVGTVSLGDGPGVEEDRRTGDRIFTGVFIPQEQAEYVVDITAEDGSGNTGGYKSASFTTMPFLKTGDVMIVADNWMPWTDPYESVYVDVLEGAGYQPDVWSTYLRGGPSVDLMQKYEAVVWYTHHNGIAISSGVPKRNAIARYLDRGGNLLIAGNHIAEDLRRDHSTWLKKYLHAEYVQWVVERYEVEGVQGDPISEGLDLPLDRSARRSDEVDPVNGGVQMLAFDDAATQPHSNSKAVAAAKKTKSRFLGPTRCVHWLESPLKQLNCDPTPRLRPKISAASPEPSAKTSTKEGVQSSGTAGVRVNDGAHKLVYLTFGLEAIEDSTKRTRLVGRIMEWFDSLPVVSMTKYVDEERAVEFGDAGLSLEFAGLSAPDSATVKKYDEVPSGRGGISEQNVSDFRFEIEPGNALTFDSSKVQLAVSDLSGIDDPSNVRIYRRDEPGTGTFSVLETTVDDNGTPGDISDDTLFAWTSSFGEFALASDSEPLPVELASFDAEVSGGKAHLTWQTASETNNTGFAVQRRVASTPGVRRAEAQNQWRKVGFVESEVQEGSAPEAKAYEFVDADLPYAADSLSYRLKQVDTDGSTSYSTTVTVEREIQEVRLLATYPNPARRQTTLRFAVPERQEVKIDLYDVLGRKVRTVVEGGRDGRQEKQLDVSRLASGVYFLRLEAEGTKKTRRLTVVR